MASGCSILLLWQSLLFVHTPLIVVAARAAHAPAAHTGRDHEDEAYRGGDLVKNGYGVAIPGVLAGASDPQEQE